MTDRARRAGGPRRRAWSTGGAHAITVLAWILAVSTVQLRERRRAVSAARARHEIRGPLSAARLALDGLDRSARVEAIDLELRRAALALDDLARGGRAAADRVEAVDVGRLLWEAAPAWRALAAGRRCELAIEPSRGRAVVRGDGMRLAQACANLMANAVEHGGGRVTIRAVAGDGRVRVEVSDTGPGLPAPIPELVAAARGRRSPRGHGLAIAAAVAARHGGRLASAPTARGARVILELPEAPPDPTPSLAALGRCRRTVRSAIRRDGNSQVVALSSVEPRAAAPHAGDPSAACTAGADPRVVVPYVGDPSAAGPSGVDPHAAAPAVPDRGASSARRAS